MDMEASVVHRAVDVHFIFGQTELLAEYTRQITGEKGETAVLSLVQEVEEPT